MHTQWVREEKKTNCEQKRATHIFTIFLMHKRRYVWSDMRSDSLTQSFNRHMHTHTCSHTYTVRQNESNRNRNGGSTWLDSNTFDKRHAFKTFSNQFNSSNCNAQVQEFTIWTCTHRLNFRSGGWFFPFIFCLFVSFYFFDSFNVLIPVLSLQFYSSRQYINFFFVVFNLSH